MLGIKIDFGGILAPLTPPDAGCKRIDGRAYEQLKDI